MTKHEYAEYQAAVDAFFEREGLKTLSAGSLQHNYSGECTSEDHAHDIEGNFEEEPWFSWCRCDCCGRLEGGNRETYIGYNPTTKEVQGDYAICSDCVYYNEYGQLDDMTMMEMEE